MAGLDPAIHVFAAQKESKTWMPGTRPGMTVNFINPSLRAKRSNPFGGKAKSGLLRR
jgi:hypothetical protein